MTNTLLTTTLEASLKPALQAAPTNNEDYANYKEALNAATFLSTDCITASSVNMFKNKLDTYLTRAGGLVAWMATFFNLVKMLCAIMCT